MYKGKRIIGIIPARSGSKGLPDKNIKELNGKPLIAYTIEAALKSNCFDNVVVSTDSEIYAEVAKRFGANVPFLRNPEFAQDTSSGWEVVIEALNKLKETYDLVVILQPTSPLRTHLHIQEAIDLFIKKQADSVVSITKMHHPLQWCNTIQEDLCMHNFITPENLGKRRQELPLSYMLNGALYIIKTELVNPNPDLYGKNSYAYKMDEFSSIDIDSEIDFLMAKTLLEYKSSATEEKQAVEKI